MMFGMSEKIKNIILGIVTLLSVTAYAQNQADTIKTQELNEVVVQADRMYMTVNKVSYSPTKQQRNASANGTMLLQQLAIPQLTVDALAGTVTMNTGKPVSFFIDGVPASNTDIADMNTRDVIRVEILDHPTDPKFRNSAHVVNYIMQKYEYGGYTKFSTTEMLLSCFSSYNTLNSKMVYKKMTFDARAYYQYTNGNHYGTNAIQHFRLPGYADVAPYGITRISMLDKSKYIANRPSASFRALYQGKNTQVSSTLNWTFNATHTDSRSGSLHYSPSIFDADYWASNYPTRKNGVRWNNEFFQQLPNDWALTASLQLAYDHVNQKQISKESDIIIRDLTAKENIWGTESEIGITKSFHGIHDVVAELIAVTYKSNIDYEGSTSNKNNTTYVVFAPGASYTFTPSDKFYTNIGLYATYYRSKASDIVESKFYPTVNFSLNYMPKRQHRLGATFNYTINTPEGSQTNAVLLQTDMLKWTQGNPYLRSYHSMVTQLSYTWNPSQYINISPVATWVYKHNYFADTYSLTDDGKGVLVKPENCGNYHNIWGAINFSAYALDRKLVIQARPGVSYHKFIGEFEQSYTSLFATLNATYYMGQFYIGASYATPKTEFNQADPIKKKIRSQYWLMAGWGNSSWTVSAFVINPFRSHWRGEEMLIDTPYYSMDTTAINVNDHRRINLSVAYTFGYGKKVQRGNDLGGTSGSTSSIR